MTDGGRQKPPPDDRTLLDPLNADELRALREARARMQAAKGGAVAHQVVIGPDTGEDIGDAPTRAMPALPQFENTGATLDKIKAPTAASGGAGRAEPARAPQQPMSMAPTQSGAQGAPASAGGGPTAGPTGFGENTLLWMAPPKINTAPPGSPAAADLAKAKAASRKGVLKTVAAVAVVVVLGSVLAYFGFSKKERAVIDLHTNPPKASVRINGAPTKNLTPMKLNLVEGTWEIEINLDGYRQHKFSVTVESGAQPSRKDIDLEPISKAGLMTVGVSVQPVSANITIDQEQFPARKTVKIANLDPKAPHKVVIEAGGYIKIEQDIPAGQLKDSYTFILQEDPNNKPQ